MAFKDAGIQWTKLASTKKSKTDKYKEFLHHEERVLVVVQIFESNWSNLSLPHKITIFPKNCYLFKNEWENVTDSW